MLKKIAEQVRKFAETLPKQDKAVLDYDKVEKQITQTVGDYEKKMPVTTKNMTAEPANNKVEPFKGCEVS